MLFFEGDGMRKNKYNGGRNVSIVRGFHSGPYLNEFYDIELCTRGGYTIDLDGVSYDIREGDLYVIFPKVEARRSFTAEETSTSYLSVKGSGVGELFESLGFSAETPMFPEKIPPRCAEILESLIDSLEVRGAFSVRDLNNSDIEFISNDSYSGMFTQEANLRQTAWFTMLISELMRIRGKRTAGNTKPTQRNYVDNAIRYMEANYHLDINVHQVADYVGINRSYLFQLFRNETGCSMQQYLINLRMKAACTLLSRADIQVKTVAASVGYEPLNFSRIFKKHIGISPTEYQKKHIGR